MLPVASYQWSLIWQNKELLFKGLVVALECAGLALGISIVAGLALALARMAKPPLTWFATIYINIFRGVPALVSVIWVYFGWSLLFNINFSVLEAGVIALTLLYSAFLSEIFRTALLSVPRGQREAGLALGMHPLRVFAQVVIPQAGRVALPNVGSMLIGMVKDTSTFSVIGMLEVTYTVQNIESTTFQPFVLYSALAGVYVTAAFVIDFVFRTIEKSLTTPPKGRVSGALTRRRKRRLESLVERLELAA
jgi:His/Glu/Gln/Arg/opine family amino acid ABC transporter permease subunit